MSDESPAPEPAEKTKKKKAAKDADAPAAAASRYLCVQCDHRFDHEGDAPLRCPKCMRRHGIEKIDAAAAGGPARERPAWLVPGVAAAVVVAVAAGYYVWSQKTPDVVEGEAPLRPLGENELRGDLRAAGAEAADALDLFTADEAIEAFAEQHATGAGPEERARSLTDAIRARASKQAFVAWGLGSPRETPVHDARRTLAAIGEDGAREKLYPLEVAALAVSALRAAGVDAMLAEVYAFEGDRRPPDPSGHFGYFAVAVYSGAAGEGTPRIFDPWGGHATAPAEDDVRVVSDAQAIGAVLSHRAIHELVHEGDTDAAFELTTRALSLDRRSPSIRSVRGATLIVAGGADEGVAELEAAAQLRADAPRHNNLAGLYLAKQDPERAEREVRAALEQHPDFAAAHATLAALHMGGDEEDLARREMEEAERIDPDLAQLPMLWANYFLMTHEVERAADKALEAVERRPHDWQQRLAAARVLRMAGRYTQMREQARRIVADAPADRRGDVEAVVRQMLGPTALDEEEEEEPPPDEGESADLGEGEGGLGAGLRLGSRLLGEGNPDAPLPNEAGMSSIGLGEPGEGLRLDLGQE
jgi:tetratricopeptide (TPR) repeat protein